MALGNIEKFLVGKDEGARAEIARRVGERLCLEDLPEAELRASEALARHLVADAIERVRFALSDAVKTAKHLPRDVALRIAHDVDSVATPFLQVTEVFSDEDWRQLVLTVSRGARIAVARRTTMSEGLAIALAEVGDSVVAQALVDNPAAPMSPPVCDTLIERFEHTGWVLDKLAERNDLFPETAARLVSRVSRTMREKLKDTYAMPSDTDALVEESEAVALLSIIRQLPRSRIPAYVERLHEGGKLTSTVMLAALREGSLNFFEAAVSIRTKVPVHQVTHLVDHGSDGALTGLLSRANIPNGTYAAVWEELKRIRATRKH